MGLVKRRETKVKVDKQLPHFLDFWAEQETAAAADEELEKFMTQTKGRRRGGVTLTAEDMTQFIDFQPQGTLVDENSLPGDPEAGSDRSKPDALESEPERDEANLPIGSLIPTRRPGSNAAAAAVVTTTSGNERLESEAEEEQAGVTQ